MKVIKTASGKNRIKMSKSEWTSIGKKAVWFGDNFDEAKCKIQEFKDKLSFYNEETAENTNDPEILHKILQRGNSDWVSGFAAENPNCALDLALKYKISLLNKNNTEEEIFGEDNGDDFNIFAKNIRI